MFSSFDFMVSALHEMLSNQSKISTIEKPKLLSFSSYVAKLHKVIFAHDMIG
jgi:hypothetical protein